MRIVTSKWAKDGYFPLLNDEQMSNKVRVEHQPEKSMMTPFHHHYILLLFVIFHFTIHEIWLEDEVHDSTTFFGKQGTSRFILKLGKFPFLQRSEYESLLIPTVWW